MPSALILIENNSAPSDGRVWSISRSLRRAGWEVKIVSAKGQNRDTASFERVDGVDIHRFAVTPSSGTRLGYLGEWVTGFVRIARLVRRLRRTTSFDVVHACNPPDFLLLATLGLRRRGVAMVFDHHDLSPELHAVKYETAFALRRGLRLLERVGFSLADVTLATNESFRDVATGRGHKRPEDVFVVRNGPDTDVFRPVDPDPSLKSGATYLIGYVGVMNSQDGVDLALDALSVLALRRSDWHAVFVGDGDFLATAKESTVRLGLDGRVTFLGFIRDPRRLVEIMSTCDVCISPEPKNPFNESCTLVKVAEYMAVGRPVVAFDLRETRRTAGDAGAYVTGDEPSAFAAAIDGLLDDPDRRDAMRAAGRKRALDMLGWNHSEDVLLVAYSRALERAGERVERRGRIQRMTEGES